MIKSEVAERLEGTVDYSPQKIYGQSINQSITRLADVSLQ
jgi:hypothetical protein